MTSFGEASAAKNLGWPIIKWLVSKFSKPPVLIEVGDLFPFVYTEPSSAEGRAFRGVRLKATNVGKTDLRCLAIIIEMRRSDNEKFINAFLPIALKTQHQEGQNRKGGEFNLRVGESKFVEVACLDEVSEESEIVLQYENNGYPNCVPRASYILKVGIYSDQKPSDTLIRLYVDGRGYLKLVKAK